MLMAETGGTGWTLSDDGTLTVTDYVMSSTIESFESAVKSIEVTETGMLSLETAPFLDGTSGSITIAAGGYLTNYATISGGTIIVNGIMENTSDGSISGGTFEGTVTNEGTISKGTFKSEVNNNGGAISESTFTAIVRNIDGGTISDGIFASTVYNIDEGAITDGTFAEIVLAGTSARVQGVDGSVPTLNGPIDNGGSILQPCNFGGNASVVENRGVIEVPATINGLAQSLRYGEKTLEQLKEINANDVWFEQAADGTQARVAESATVGLESRAYVSKDLPRVSAPAAKIDFDGEAVTVSLDATFALPQGLQRGELVAVLLPRGGERNAQLRIAAAVGGGLRALHRGSDGQGDAGSARTHAGDRRRPASGRGRPAHTARRRARLRAAQLEPLPRPAGRAGGAWLHAHTLRAWRRGARMADRRDDGRKLRRAPRADGSE